MKKKIIVVLLLSYSIATFSKDENINIVDIDQERKLSILISDILDLFSIPNNTKKNYEAFFTNFKNKVNPKFCEFELKIDNIKKEKLVDLTIASGIFDCKKEKKGHYDEIIILPATIEAEIKRFNTINQFHEKQITFDKIITINTPRNFDPHFDNIYLVKSLYLNKYQSSMKRSQLPNTAAELETLLADIILSDEIKQKPIEHVSWMRELKDNGWQQAGLFSNIKYKFNKQKRILLVGNQPLISIQTEKLNIPDNVDQYCIPIDKNEKISVIFKSIMHMISNYL